MPTLQISQQEVSSLKAFYDLMAATREIRFSATTAIFSGSDPAAGTSESLDAALASLKAILTSTTVPVKPKLNQVVTS